MQEMNSFTKKDEAQKEIEDNVVLLFIQQRQLRMIYLYIIS